MRPYPEEEIEEGVKYIEDTALNRRILKTHFGPPLFEFDDKSYILINTEENIWFTTFTFQWLYRNPPHLSEISTLLK